MKNFKLITSFSLVLTLLLASCSVEKRHYNKGFHVDWNSKAPKATEQAYTQSKQSNVQPIAEGPATTVAADVKATGKTVETPELTASTTKTPVKKAAKAAKAPSLIANGKNTATESQSVDLKKSAAATTKIAKKITNAMGGGKSQLVALLLCIFVGAIGIHRLYLGYVGIFVLQLITLGGCGIWTLIDLIRIITGDLGPKGGSYSETL